MFENNNDNDKKRPIPPNQPYQNNDDHTNQEDLYQQYGYYQSSFYNNIDSNASESEAEQSAGEPSPEKPKKKRTLMRIIAGLTACLVISAGSIGGFVSMVNAGLITIGSSQSASASDSDNSSSNNSSIQQISKTNGEELTLQEVAAKVTPSVVCIQNYQSSRFGQETEASEGSGIIMSEDGYIITNAHVVDGAASLKVILYDGTEYDAELVGSDTATDLALIKIKATGLVAAEFGDADELTVGDQVVAIGNPGGLTLSSSVTFGYVSALNRSIETSNGYTVNCIQTDAAINPGNSGGALVNTYGQVVGINSSKIAATGYEGLGFAISINEALPIIENIKEYGYVKDRPVIGISYQFVDSTTSSYYRLPVGLYVADVSADNAKNAGLERGDVITKIEGIEVDSSAVIAQALENKKPGDTIQLEVYKGSTGKTVTVTLTLSEYSAAS